MHPLHDRQEVATLSELWKAAYYAGYADAVLEHAPQAAATVPDELPIVELPYPVLL